MDNFRHHFGLAVLMSELGHVFCCVLPTVFTVLSFAANIGLIGMAPSWLMEIHQGIHHYEIHIIAFSGTMLLLGWIAFFYANKMDCHYTGCGHPPCDPSKVRNRRIMIAASILFIINLLIYAAIHRNMFDLEVFSHLGIQHVEETHID